MSEPAPYFVRTWTVDPAGEEPDHESDTDAWSEVSARTLAKQLRRKGANAGAFERRNIRVPDFVPSEIVDVPAHLYDYESVQLDEDEP